MDTPRITIMLFCRWSVAGRGRPQQGRDQLSRQQGRHSVRHVPADRARRVPHLRQVWRQAYQGQPLQLKGHR